MASAPITCITCHLVFGAHEDQRQHYKTDYHRFNLKRKVAALPPVTFEAFEKKMHDIKEEEEKKGFSGECAVCKKHYSSKAQYEQHMLSKRHKENLTADSQKKKFVPVSSASATPSSVPTTVIPPSVTPPASAPSPAPALEAPVAVAPAATPAPAPSVATTPLPTVTEATPEREKTEEELIEEKIANAPKLPPNHCLFCRHVSRNAEKNVKHMAKEHGFFIPDVEFLQDLAGLLDYLLQKVSVGNVCLFCNGRGRSYQTLEAVQAHMRDTCHCKLKYEEDVMEYADYYDFTKTYEEVDEDEEPQSQTTGTTSTTTTASTALVPAPTKEERALAKVDERARRNVEVGDAGLSLKFPDGREVGHRSLRIYYRQRPRRVEDRPYFVSNIMSQYQRLGWRGNDKPVEHQVQMTRHDFWIQQKNTMRIMKQHNRVKMQHYIDSTSV